MLQIALSRCRAKTIVADIFAKPVSTSSRDRGEIYVIIAEKWKRHARECDYTIKNVIARVFALIRKISILRAIMHRELICAQNSTPASPVLSPPNSACMQSWLLVLTFFSLKRCKKIQWFAWHLSTKRRSVQMSARIGEAKRNHLAFLLANDVSEGHRRICKVNRWNPKLSHWQAFAFVEPEGITEFFAISIERSLVAPPKSKHFATIFQYPSWSKSSKSHV